MSLDSLANKGIITNLDSEEPGRTFIVTGLERSGTSLVASLLQEIGVFMGAEINDAVYQDEEISRLQSKPDMRQLRRIILSRNAKHKVWGFKLPMLWKLLSAEQISIFDRPRLIVTFRDPVAIAV